MAEGIVNVEALLTQTYPLEDTEKAITNLKDRINNPMKVQIVL
mgnify:CR=1 FL=1